LILILIDIDSLLNYKSRYIYIFRSVTNCGFR